jgi:hypothetical protein
MTREAMEQALEALENIDKAMPFPVGKQTITALKAALEQPEQEPVGEVVEINNDGFKCEFNRRLAVGTKLYTFPPAAQPVQEPVLQEIEQYRMQMAGISTAAIGYWKVGDGIHPDYDTVALRDVAKLYAKYDELYKAKEALAQPVQKPVACRFCHDKKGCWAWQCDSCGEIDDVQQPAPQRPWQGLTEFQFAEIYNKWNDTNGSTPWGLNQALEAKLRNLNK